MASESRDEVRQRISTLYDQAENATGNYNGTRAMSAGSRNRGVPLRKRAGTDPDLDNVTRQWFDAARAKLGPTVPAALPADRMPPQRPAGGRPTAPTGGGFPGGERESADRALPPELAAWVAERAAAELTGGRPVAELPGRPVAELTARPIAALPAVPEPRRELEAAAAALLPAPSPAPGAAPRRPSPATSKGQNQRKLTAARDLLSRSAAQRGTPVAAIESRPAEESWFPAQPLGSTGSFATGALTGQPGMAAATTTPATANPLTDTGAFAAPAPAASPYTTGTFTTGGLTAQPGMAAAMTTPATANPLTDTGAFAAPAPAATTSPYTTGTFTTVAPAAQVGMPAATASPYATGTFTTGGVTDTGSFAAVGVGGAAESAYAGKAMKALAFARAQIGKPCVWGAMGPGSYDCSSLTQAAWRAAGVELPRTAAEQAGAGTPVTTADIQVGDLIVFFDNASHVGFSTGNGMMIHAPGPGAFIREESIYGAGETAIHRVIRPA
ncbi:C40 family peptidase [Streptomyces sp. NPDC086549]|uniref:C40 family peptidase n=1 Tax=Streptomyces sp. NPDC086549 TaxID=3365752 RepID=UPI00380371C8